MVSFFGGESYEERHQIPAAVSSGQWTKITHYRYTITKRYFPKSLYLFFGK
jgi:hypothetical protein